MEGQLKVDAVAFDLWLAKGCVDVAKQDCCRLPPVLTLCMTRGSTGSLGVWHCRCREIHKKTADNKLLSDRAVKLPCRLFEIMI